MTDYLPIANSEVDANSPITETLMTRLRDNPLAIGEGSPGAPNIQRPGIADGAVNYDKLESVIARTRLVSACCMFDNNQVISPGSDFNITSIVRNSSANYTITFDNPVTAEEALLVGGSFSTTNNISTHAGFALSNTSWQLYTVDTASYNNHDYLINYFVLIGGGQQ